MYSVVPLGDWQLSILFHHTWPREKLFRLALHTRSRRRKCAIVVELAVLVQRCAKCVRILVAPACRPWR